MRRLIECCVVLMVLACGLTVSRQARAEMTLGEHKNGGLGFHNVEAPVGVRWWLPGQKIGIDVGLGFGATPASAYPDESLTFWALDAGVPFVIHSWERVHVLLRPGVLYQSRQEAITTPPTAFDTDNATIFDASLEIEAEAFLMNNCSVSASHGLRYRSDNAVGSGDSRTSWGTIGNNFTTIGFHVYFFGGDH